MEWFIGRFVKIGFERDKEEFEGGEIEMLDSWGADGLNNFLEIFGGLTGCVVE